MGSSLQLKCAPDTLRISGEVPRCRAYRCARVVSLVVCHDAEVRAHCPAQLPALLRPGIQHGHHRCTDGLHVSMWCATHSAGAVRLMAGRLPGKAVANRHHRDWHGRASADRERLRATLWQCFVLSPPVLSEKVFFESRSHGCEV